VVEQTADCFLRCCPRQAVGKTRCSACWQICGRSRSPLQTVELLLQRDGQRSALFMAGFIKTARHGLTGWPAWPISSVIPEAA